MQKRQLLIFKNQFSISQQRQNKNIFSVGKQVSINQKSGAKYKLIKTLILYMYLEFCLKLIL